MSVGQGTLPSSGHATGRAPSKSANSRLQVLKSGQLCKSVVGQHFILCIYRIKNYQITVKLFKKPGEHFYEIFQVLWCLETPVEAL